MPKFDEIKLAGQLPSPKGVALAIMNLCGRDDTTIDDIARLVQTDPALSGRLLRLANTSGGGHRPIAAVNEALLRIGMKAVGQLAMGFSLVDQFKEGPCKAFDYRSFWSHSLLMALAARELGRLTRVAAPEDLFACGLMANIGSLALATAFPVEYSALLESGSHDPLAAERETFGIDRRECTLAMLEDFGIPKALAEPVFYHLAPDESQFSDASRPSRLTWLFHTAHHLADLGVAAEATRSQLAGSLIRLGGRFEIDADGTATMFDRIVAEWDQWARLLEIPATSLPSFERMSETPPVAAEPDGAASSVRVLMVTACPTSVTPISTLLQSAFGYRTYLAGDGDEGLSMAVAMLPHVVVVDADTPSASAHDFCRRLRATDWGKSVYLIVMTATVDERNFVAAFESGADTCLCKSLGDARLRAAMRAAHRYLGLLDAWQTDRVQLKQIASELAVSNRKLEQVARTDLLTGLPNRRGGMEALARAWSASNRSGEALCVMMLDIDWFKRINDRYGHAFGDRVLEQVGAGLRSEARSSDTLCRIGGEEFLVVCSGSDLRSTMTAAERLRRAIATLGLVAGEGEQVELSISVGIAQKEAGTSSTDVLLGNADKALYAAKHAGRNRICVMAHGKLHHGGAPVSGEDLTRGSGAARPKK